MLDSIYNMMMKKFCNIVLGVKTPTFGIHMRRCYGRHFIMLPKSVNHLWFINYNTWHYITAACDVMS